VRAWWSGSAAALRAADAETIVARLALRLVEAHPLNREEQLRAWRTQIPLLATALHAAPDGWQVLLEYPLLRLGRRIDAVILTDRAILVLEFKSGAQGFTPAGRAQVDDYALDLRDFHAGSRNHPIVPILVAPDAPAPSPVWPLIWHFVAPVLDASARSLPSLLAGLAARLPAPSDPLDPAAWEAAPYRPVPTIVEAARMLFRRHGVTELATARADAANLTRTTAAIRGAIAAAQAGRQHLAVFVTGIPGAGKTLCGLNVVFGAEAGAAFLTGNLPLVHVMREALARDAAAQGRGPRQPRQETESAIQPVNGFLKDNLPRSLPPHEHVIVFDEAQRAWDAAFGRRKFTYDASEAALILDVMARHRDWAVVVALVGGGQEINTGEAGLAEWGAALAARSAWRALAAPGAVDATDPRQRLFSVPPAGLAFDPDLHLQVPVRAIRSAAAAPWVEAMLAGKADEAAAIAAAAEVPFRLTRSLEALRAGLRRRARGLRRSGLVCSAGARRLVADGLWPAFPHLDADAVAHWFLDRWPDVRASDALELPATQFACQGLELDYVGLAWGNDLIRRAGHWQPRRFAGSAWQDSRAEARAAYGINTYRVLLTRARYETLIFVPKGDPGDGTRSPAEFDAVAAFLAACGAKALEEDAVRTEEPTRVAALL
jgi:Schlafen group 3, DNA/RNA helicase domain